MVNKFELSWWGRVDSVGEERTHPRKRRKRVWGGSVAMNLENFGPSDVDRGRGIRCGPLDVGGGIYTG